MVEHSGIEPLTSTLPVSALPAELMPHIYLNNTFYYIEKMMSVKGFFQKNRWKLKGGKLPPVLNYSKSPVT